MGFLPFLVFCRYSGGVDLLPVGDVVGFLDSLSISFYCFPSDTP